MTKIDINVKRLHLCIIKLFSHRNLLLCLYYFRHKLQMTFSNYLTG